MLDVVTSMLRRTAADMLHFQLRQTFRKQKVFCMKKLKKNSESREFFQPKLNQKYEEYFKKSEWKVVHVMSILEKIDEKDKEKLLNES